MVAPVPSSGSLNPHVRQKQEVASLPAPVKQYILRAYGSCKTQSEKDTMEKMLKLMIAAAQRDGTIHTKNWDSMSVPSLSSQGSSQSMGQDQHRLPQSVRNYIHRAYASCKTSAAKDAMETCLKQMINTAQKDGSLNTRNWDAMPVPLVMEAPPLPPAQPLPEKGKEPEKKKTKTKKNRVELDVLNPSKNEERAARFAEMIEKKPKKKTSSFAAIPVEFDDSGKLDLESMRVVGTCEKLEKNYLRLTSAPDPSTVRPVKVLKQTLKMLLTKWEEKTRSDADSVYLYVSEQFRSMRQDLTVQNVKDNFAVVVYEKNARIAIEMSDMHEFNACQTQLWSLYATVDKRYRKHLAEFTSYRILYFQHTKNYLELGAMYAHKNFLGFQNACINHAEMVRRAVEDKNWVQFKRLFRHAPNMNSFFMNILLIDFRKQVLSTLLKSRMKEMTLSHALKVLDFEIENDLEIAQDFLMERTVTFRKDGQLYIDISKSLKKIAEM